MGHSAAPLYSAAAGHFAGSFAEVLGRLWWLRELLECTEPESARVEVESASPSGGGGSFMLAMTCSSSQDSS